MKTILILIIGLLFISIMTIFDKLLKLEYKSYRNYWERDGKPRGVFWIPPKSFWSFRSAMSQGMVARKWLFSTPEWMKNNVQAIRLIKGYRILSILVFSIILIPILLIIGMLFLYYIG